MDPDTMTGANTAGATMVDVLVLIFGVMIAYVVESKIETNSKPD